MQFSLRFELISISFVSSFWANQILLFHIDNANIMLIWKAYPIETTNECNYLAVYID